MVTQDMEQLANEVRVQVEEIPARFLSPVVESVAAALRETFPELNDARIGGVLMTAASAAARASEDSGEFLSAKGIVLALGAAGLQFHDAASAGTTGER
ncbi:hypothetical protein [Streptomyces sp. NPDC056672]|uniref:hypothetical protein n=1 Tax=Streptomyces sp. NPDC056672 TaxID=3345906 RepID=UPI003698F572